MSKTTVITLAAATAIAASCAHRAPDRREERRDDRREERRDDRRDDRRDEHRGHHPDSRADWTKLGERWVDGARDRDVIAVGAGEGRYRRIMLVVEQSALEMRDVVVHFGDGTHFSPSTRVVFSADTRSRVIDLPGADRVIRSVEFRYGNLPGGGRAQIEVWAQ